MSSDQTDIYFLIWNLGCGKNITAQVPQYPQNWDKQLKQEIKLNKL